MNRELEALIRAYDAVLLADNEHAPEVVQAFEALLDKVVTRHTHLERERLRRAVHHAHRLWQRAQDKPTTLPPQA